MKRRELLHAGMTAAVLALGTARRARAQDNPWAALLAQYERVRPSSFSRPLPVPPVLTPARVVDGHDVYEMTVRAGTAQPLDGTATAIIGYDGRWPGPTIRAVRGRPVVVRLKNACDRDVSMHNHGMSCGPQSDGHPVDYVRPGATKEYRYPNAQAAGTFWFHDHVMGRSGEHVYRGMAGFYLITDPAEDALGLPRGAHDVPIVLQDRLFDEQNALSYTVDSGSIFTGHFGNTLCANGVFTPFFAAATRRYRLRLLNGCNSRPLKMGFSDGRPLTVIACDGHLLEAPLTMRAIELAPSERCDCIVDFGADPVGTSVVLRNTDATYPVLQDALRFDVVRKERDDSRVPARLASITRLREEDAVVQRVVRMQVDDGKWTLNGLKFDPARIDFKPRLGTVEVWTLHNAETTQMHPFHQHLVPFQVLDVDGATPPPLLRGWKDAVAVGPGSKVRIIMRFTAFTGVYVFHCHKLEHEDHAMMLQQEVVS